MNMTYTYSWTSLCKSGQGYFLKKASALLIQKPTLPALAFSRFCLLYCFCFFRWCISSYRNIVFRAPLLWEKILSQKSTKVQRNRSLKGTPLQNAPRLQKAVSLMERKHFRKKITSLLVKRMGRIGVEKRKDCFLRKQASLRFIRHHFL